MHRILLAEDDFLIRLSLADELKTLGHEVVEAGSGDEALSLFDTQGPFDILVTDLQMPGLTDGIGLAAHARSIIPDLPVIYVTGRPEALAKLSALGPHDAFVRKPFTPSELAKLVAGLIEQGEGAQHF